MSHYLNYPEEVVFKVSVQRTAKSILLTMLAICMTLGLTSCGGSTKGKTENQVKTDISEVLSQGTFSGYNLNVSSFSVSKRQTNTEDKTDFVWCDVTATGTIYETDEFSCSIECEVTYVLYNDGWQLDTYTCEIVPSSIKPLSYPTQEKVEYAAKHPDFDFIPTRVEIHDMIQKSDTEVVYPVDRYYDGTGQIKETKITFIFDLSQGWHRPR